MYLVLEMNQTVKVQCYYISLLVLLLVLVCEANVNTFNPLNLLFFLEFHLSI